MNKSKILVVEDESIVALDIQARLIRLGYQVIGIADSGEGAIRLAETTPPDLALMDIRLKGDMDGVETAQQLRARFDVPVIYLTAYADEVTLQRAKVTEPFGFLVKPFEEREMHSTVEMALYKIHTEKQSKLQTARLQALMGSVPEGIALLGNDGHILLANSKAEEYLTVLADKGIHEAITSLCNLPIDQLAIHTNGDIWHEIEVNDSSQRVFEVSISPVQENAVTTISLDRVIVIREVTAEREIQKRIQLQDRLAVVGQFAAGVAHDFNNILSSIILSSYTVQKVEPALSPKSHSRLDTISQQAKRASNLIQQILDFSRISHLEMHAFNLLPLIKELAKMLERLLPENIHLKFGYTADDFTFHGDSTRILQLLMNLSINARDAMPDGGILNIQVARVHAQDIATDKHQDTDHWIRITVTDNGTGINPEVLPHIFEPFFTTKEQGKGTGLGLAQVYGIVQQHQGQIAVESQVGHGTTFRLHFPILCQPLSNKAKPVPTQTDTLQGNQQTILIVEDDLSVADSFRDFLELSNYRVLSAKNGREALTILHQPGTDVDLIISDMVMPEMGGLELCRTLRQSGSTVRIITMTGYSSEEALQEMQSLGVVDCITKPVGIRQMLKTIEKALLNQA